MTAPFVIPPADGYFLGVGADIVLLVLQSEHGAGSAGLADPTHFDTTDERVRQWGQLLRPGVISAADEPLDFNWDSHLGLSPFNSFARQYLRWVAPNRWLLVVPLAVGSTGFTNSVPTWKTTVEGNLTDNAIEQALLAKAAADELGTSRFVGVFALGGQADAGKSKAQYDPLIDAMVDALRDGLDAPTLRFVVTQMLPEWIDNHPDGVDASQIDLPRRKYYTAYVDSPRGFPVETINPTHMNPVGTRVRGPGQFDAWLRAGTNTPDSLPGEPGALQFIQSGDDLILTWGRPDGHHVGYRVEIREGAGAYVEVDHDDLTNSHTFPDLVLGSTYTASVVTLGDDDTESDPVTGTITLVTLPGQVTGLTIPTPTLLALDPVWDEEELATSYLLEYRALGDDAWIAGPTVEETTGSITSLSPSTTYQVRSTGANAAGFGPPSDPVEATTPAIPGPFDLGFTAAPLIGYAFSRRLDADYTGALIRVRRSSDNTEKDIGQVNGVLDVDDDLLPFCAGADGFITKVYSQVLSAPDLAQPTAAKQPKIVSAGVLEQINGRAWAMFDGVDDILFNASPPLWAQGATGVTIALVMKYFGSTSRRILGETRSGQATPAIYYLGTGGSGNTKDFAVAIDDAGANIINANTGSGDLADALHLWIVKDAGTVLTHKRDATLAATFPTYTRAGHSASPNRLVLGGGIRTTEELQANFGCCAFIAFAGMLTTTEEASLRSNCQTFYGTP